MLLVNLEKLLILRWQPLLREQFGKNIYYLFENKTKLIFRENVNISSQLAQLTEKATSLTAENDKLAIREMTNKTKVSLLEAEIEKLSRRNAYRSF